MNNKDYYKILGVSKDSSQDEIKKAYRKLARKYHPDLNPGDAQAEQKFKEIQEAYSVLSNPQKRKQYDSYGRVGNFGKRTSGQTNWGGGFEGFDFGNFGEGSFSDIFESIFDVGKRKRESRTRVVKGEDLYYNITLNFEDAIKGLTSEIIIQRKKICQNCGGAGYKNRSKTTCPTCKGTGKVYKSKFHLKFSSTCPQCGGTGYLPGPVCNVCGGAGRVDGQERIKVRIPAGVKKDARLRLKGKGNAGIRNGEPGDLFITVNVLPHKFFKREGDNIYVKIPITFTEASLGAKIKVPTVENYAVMKIPPETKSGQKFRMKGKGVYSEQTKRRGDQFVTVQIVPPPIKDLKVRELLKEIESVADYDPRKNLNI